MLAEQLAEAELICAPSHGKVSHKHCLILLPRFQVAVRAAQEDAEVATQEDTDVATQEEEFEEEELPAGYIR